MSPEPSCRALQFRHPVRFRQAEEAVANLPLRLAVRAHCGHPARAQYDGVLAGYSSGTKLGVL